MLFYSLKFGGPFFNGSSKYILVPISLINIIGGVMIGFVRISNGKEINSEKDNSSKEEIASCERNVKEINSEKANSSKKEIVYCKIDFTEINSEKDDSIIEAENDNEAKEPKHVITAEIRIEVTGEDEPTKYDKRRERWVIVALFSLAVLALSVISFFMFVNEYFFWLIIISVIVSGYSLAKAMFIDPEEPTGHTPWYYGAL